MKFSNVLLLTQASTGGPHTSLSDVNTGPWWRHLRLRLPDIQLGGEGARRGTLPSPVSCLRTGTLSRYHAFLFFSASVSLWPVSGRRPAI